MSDTNNSAPEKDVSFGKAAGIKSAILNRARNFSMLGNVVKSGGWKTFDLHRIFPGTDILLAGSVLLIIAAMFIPLPIFLLDIGLAISITLSVLILMVALFLEKPLDFTSFPSLLLLTTTFRLSLEISTTKAILSRGNEGPYAAGHVVAAFGGLLMGNDVIIGGIVFCILMVVNFMVITKGSGRIAEVAARFTLDAMPGKQMAIDQDIASGALNERQARAKRKELEAVSNFFGAMDGAAKFVRNDAIASIIIIAINIIGGLAIGVIRYSMPVADAAKTFTTLTIGDGLVSQIPALLVSLAAGIVVTKGSTDEKTDVTLFKQLGGTPKPLAIASFLAGIFAFMPGMPMVPFLIISGLTAAGAWARHKAPQVDSDGDITEVTPPAPSVPPITDLLKIDLIQLEIGFGLLTLANGDDSPLTTQIKALRRRIALELGFILPSIRIKDDMALDNDTYSIKIKEIEIGSGQVKPGRLLAILPMGANIRVTVPGEPAKEPTFNLPARWIEPSDQAKAIAEKCTVVEPSTVIITHLSESLRSHMGELLTYPETQALLDNLPHSEQKLVNDIIPSQVSLITVQRVLQALLQENVSIRDLPSILESIQEGVAQNLKGIMTLTGYVRRKLSRQISSSLTTPSGYIPIITISRKWETDLMNNTTGAGDERVIAMPPKMLNQFITSLKEALHQASQREENPVLITISTNRDIVRQVVERISPSTPVVSQAELYPRCVTKTIATVA